MGLLIALTAPRAIAVAAGLFFGLTSTVANRSGLSTTKRTISGIGPALRGDARRESPNPADGKPGFSTWESQRRAESLSDFSPVRMARVGGLVPPLDEPADGRPGLALDRSLSAGQCVPSGLLVALSWPRFARCV